MKERHDPNWERFPAGLDSNMTGLGKISARTVGVGSYFCSDCTLPHVVIATIMHDVEMDMFLTPAVAREVAASLIRRANELDAGGLN